MSLNPIERLKDIRDSLDDFLLKDILSQMIRFMESQENANEYSCGRLYEPPEEDL